jgi:thiamine pyrophosphokinase
MMRVLLWLNSNAPSRKLISQLADDVDIVAGVDGGYDRALECGFVPDMVIGDLDSVQSSCEGIQRVPIPDQESSDLVKAITYLKEAGYDEFEVVGIEGGLESHQLGVWGALVDAPEGVVIRLHTDRSEIIRINPNSPPFRVGVPIGSVFSVFALQDCQAVTVEGGKWNLKEEGLKLSTKGLHNVAVAEFLSFSSDGVAVAIINR